MALMRAEIREFVEADIDEAGRLLADRHRRHRDQRPLLSPRFEDPGLAVEELRAAWAADGSSGAVAVQEGRMTAYLLGAPKQAGTWGPNVWVESAGQAVAADVAAEAIRDLYAVAATRWVAEGRTAQYVVVPSSDADLVAAWFRLCFGHQQTHALRRPLESTPPSPPGVTVRPAERDDIPVLAQLDLALPQHQGLAPCFSSGHLFSYEESVQEWESEWGNPDFPTFVAELDGRVAGYTVVCSVTQSSGNSGLIRPDNAGYFALAAVLPEARGRGVGRAVAEAALAWAAKQGFDVVATDWRQTNLLSSRAWPALGYQDTFWRLHRTVGH